MNFVPEISRVIGKIEVLYEDDSFYERKLTALVTSKVYYHLVAFEDSLSFALGAGDLFNVNSNSEYVQTIIAKCIDHYTERCLVIFDDNGANKPTIDSNLEQKEISKL